MNTRPLDLLQEFNTQRTELMNIRNFKLAIHKTKSLTQHGIDNLAKYLDKNNEGLISMGEFVA